MVAWPRDQHESIENEPSNASSKQDQAQDTFARTNLGAIHNTTQVNKLHAKSLRGKGIRVALVDGGVDYFHPALGGGFGAGYKIDYGWDFVGDNVRPPLKEQPDDDPFGDCSDHATHTAGILFGNDTSIGFTGVAPGISVELYRVFDCNGMSTSDVVVRAVLKAYERGVDLINLSLGSGSRPFSDDPLASLISRINKAGPTFIVTAAGNSGHAGTFSAAAPEGGGPDVFSVGAVDSSHEFSVLRPGRATISTAGSYSTQEFVWNIPTWTSWWRSTFPEAISLTMVVSTVEGNNVSDACQELALNPALYHDKVVLVRRGGCSLKSKMENLVRAGGRYILIYNNLPGPIFDLEVRLEDNGIVGAGSLDMQTGESLAALLKSGSGIVLEMDSNFTSPSIIRSHLNEKTADRVSTFSSWGPSGEGHFVPTLLGPGGGVLSTLPRQRGSWGVQSGTSMAVPYITGCIALLKEAFPDLSSQYIANLLVSTSVPLPFSDGTGASYDFLASAWQQGAGRVDVYRAFQSKVRISHRSLAFNDTEFYAGPQSFSVSNTGDETVRYMVSHIPAVTVLSLSRDEEDRYPVPLSSGNRKPEATEQFLRSLVPEDHADIQFSISRLVLRPGESETIQVTAQIASLTRPDLADFCPLYSGYVVLESSNKENGQQDIRIPYGGIACKIRSISTISPSRNTTFLAAATREDADMASFRSRFAGTQYLRAVPADYVFELAMADDSDPALYASLVLPTMQVDLSIYTRAIRFELLPQHENQEDEAVALLSADSMFPVGGFGRIETVFQHWTGLLPNGSWASAGKYRIRVSALRLFGQPENEGDFQDRLTTDPFYIQYSTDPHSNKSQEAINIAESLLASSFDKPCQEYTIF